MASWLAPTPYWCDHPRDIDPAESVYPLRAIASNAPCHNAPLTDTDRAVITQIRAGNAAVFESLYRDYASGLIGFAARLCGSRAMAQDVVAELFVYLWERRAEWNPRAGIRAYLFTAIRHRASDALRTQRRANAREELFVRDPSLMTTTLPTADTAADAELEERVAAVWRVIDTFPVMRRQVMYLRWARELTAEEIATVLGVSRNAVDKHLSRAAAAIRDVLG